MDGTEADSDRNTSWCRKPSFHAGLTLAMIFNKASLWWSSWYNSYQVSVPIMIRIALTLSCSNLRKIDDFFRTSRRKRLKFIYHFSIVTKCSGNTKKPAGLYSTAASNKVISGWRLVMWLVLPRPNLVITELPSCFLPNLVTTHKVQQWSICWQVLPCMSQAPSLTVEAEHENVSLSVRLPPPSSSSSSSSSLS